MHGAVGQHDHARTEYLHGQRGVVHIAQVACDSGIARCGCTDAPRKRLIQRGSDDSQLDVGGRLVGDDIEQVLDPFVGTDQAEVEHPSRGAWHLDPVRREPVPIVAVRNRHGRGRRQQLGVIVEPDHEVGATLGEADSQPPQSSLGIMRGQVVRGAHQLCPTHSDEPEQREVENFLRATPERRPAGQHGLDPLDVENVVLAAHRTPPREELRLHVGMFSQSLEELHDVGVGRRPGPLEGHEHPQRGARLRRNGGTHRCRTPRPHAAFPSHGAWSECHAPRPPWTPAVCRRRLVVRPR